jgi:hypothetical protein
MLSACTFEIDDVEIAVDDILSQLKIDENLLPNSIGIITCCGEFVETGVLKAICSALPFSIIGMETAASSTSGKCGELMLAISVITSDDSRFVATLSDKMDGTEKNIVNSCLNGSKHFSKEPKMILAFCPKNPNINITYESIFNIISDTRLNIPVIGGVAVATEGKTNSAKIFFNGDTFDNRFVEVVFCGKIEPKFIIRDIPMDKIVRENGLVTKSKENLICGINNLQFDEYLLEIGISQEIINENLHSIPFWFDFDGRKESVPRSVEKITEEGFGFCSGNIPSGITMSVGKFTKRDVLNTAEKIFNDAIENKNLNGIFLLSCFERFVAMEADLNGEMNLLQKLFYKNPYHFVYSNGEYLSNWHNFSIIGFGF